MSSLELKIPPLALVGIFGAAMPVAACVAPGLSVPFPARNALSIALLLIGLAVALAGVIAFRTHKTTVNPFTPGSTSTVVRAGIYGVSRNPMYLGFLLALGALAVYLSNALAFALLPAFVAYMNRFQIKPEERALTEKFGQEFTLYMAKVRRWI